MGLSSEAMGRGVPRTIGGRDGHVAVGLVVPDEARVAMRDDDRSCTQQTGGHVSLAATLDGAVTARRLCRVPHVRYSAKHFILFF